MGHISYFLERLRQKLYGCDRCLCRGLSVCDRQSHLFISQSPCRREMELSPSFCSREPGCVYGLFRGLSPDLKIQLPAPATHQGLPGRAQKGREVGGRVPWAGEQRDPREWPRFVHLGNYYLCLPCQHRSLSGAYTSQSGFFPLTGKGAALAAWLRESGCLTYIPHCRDAEPSPSPLGVSAGVPATLRAWTVHLLPTSHPPHHSQSVS